MNTPQRPAAAPTATESVDIKKLTFILFNNRVWIVGIVIITNLAAYLIMRWTKDSYTSEAEMKLNSKQDIINIAANTTIHPPKMDILAGEIERIKSNVFLDLVIDSLQLDIGYFSMQGIVKNEKYKHVPIAVIAKNIPDYMQDVPICLKQVDAQSYWIEVDLRKKKKYVKGVFGKELTIQALKFTIHKTPYYNSLPDGNFYFVFNSRKKLFDYFSKNLSAEPLNVNANTIRVALKDYNAAKAHSIVNTIITLYIRYREKQDNRSTEKKIEWLNKELMRVEDTLQRFEKYFGKYALHNKSNDIYEDIKQIAFHLNQLDSQQVDRQKKINNIDTLINRLSNNPSFLLLNPMPFLPSYLNKKIETLQNMIRRQKTIELSYKENTRAFRQQEDELNLLKHLILYQMEEIRKKWREDVTEMNQKKAYLEKKFFDTPGHNTRFSKNHRLYTLYENFYLSIIKSKAQFEITQADNTSDVQILSPAVLPDKPTTPIKAMIMGAGFLAGILFGFLFVGTLYLLNDKITGNEIVEQKTSAPLWGSLPASSNPLPRGLIIKESPKSKISEAIRTLRTSLDSCAVDTPKKIIAISSTAPGEGKSLLAFNLSAALAFSGKKVILINANMRKDNDNEMIKCPDTNKGLSALLTTKQEWENCIADTGVENMDYIPAGPSAPNPSELLMGNKFAQLLAELKQKYECIILDTPPAGMVTDGIIAMKKADIAIYIFRINYSKKAFLEIFNKMTYINKIKNVAIVTNAVSTLKMAYRDGLR